MGRKHTETVCCENFLVDFLVKVDTIKKKILGSDGGALTVHFFPSLMQLKSYNVL